MKETSFKLREALKNVVKKINMKKINEIIDEIPAEKENIKIISQSMKKFYKDFLNAKYEKILLPALNKVLEYEKNQKKNY